MLQKPLFIYEMANNHQGDVKHGLKIIEQLKEVSKVYEEMFDFGIKFQYRNLDTFIHKNYHYRDDVKNVKRFKDTRLTEKQFLTLKNAVTEAGYVTICTPFDEASVDKIVDHDYDILKIASCSVSDWPLLEKIATAKKRVIMSSAGANLERIKQVINFFRNRNIDVSLMHCVAEYPTPIEQLNLNQIDLFKTMFNKLTIGYSTHEEPNNFHAVQMAIAKGVMILEKHVGVKTDKISLNMYSATPQQVSQWLEAAKKAYISCGVVDQRYNSTEAEINSLLSLKRGAFIKNARSCNDKLTIDDVYFAFPSIQGQLCADEFSKYNSFVLLKEKGADQVIMKTDVDVVENRNDIVNVVKKVIAVIRKSGVVIPNNSRCELSHHYGIDKYEDTGVAIINCINREYCKKILVMLPGQNHPVHHHKLKEESFSMIYGDLECVLDNSKHQISRGDNILVERGVNHSFSSRLGCVFEEISTTHHLNDSYYIDLNVIKNRKTEVYFTKSMIVEVENNND